METTLVWVTEGRQVVIRRDPQKSCNITHLMAENLHGSIIAAKMSKQQHMGEEAYRRDSVCQR